MKKNYFLLILISSIFGSFINISAAENKEQLIAPQQSHGTRKKKLMIGGATLVIVAATLGIIGSMSKDDSSSPVPVQECSYLSVGPCGIYSTVTQTGICSPPINLTDDAVRAELQKIFPSAKRMMKSDKDPQCTPYGRKNCITFDEAIVRMVGACNSTSAKSHPKGIRTTVKAAHINKRKFFSAKPGKKSHR